MGVLGMWVDELESSWLKDRPGRDVSVPQPVVVKENNRAQVDLKVQDRIVVQDGGDQDIEPRGFAWDHERNVTRLSFDLMSADRRIDGSKVDGRVRMFGQYDEVSRTLEDAGGLVGEVRAILNANRRGFGPWDYVNTTTVNDVTDTAGKNKYRAKIDVELVVEAAQL